MPAKDSNFDISSVNLTLNPMIVIQEVAEVDIGIWPSQSSYRGNFAMYTIVIQQLELNFGHIAVSFY